MNSKSPEINRKHSPSSNIDMLKHEPFWLTREIDIGVSVLPLSAHVKGQDASYVYCQGQEL